MLQNVAARVESTTGVPVGWLSPSLILQNHSISCVTSYLISFFSCSKRKFLSSTTSNYEPLISTINSWPRTFLNCSRREIIRFTCSKGGMKSRVLPSLMVLWRFSTYISVKCTTGEQLMPAITCLCSSTATCVFLPSGWDSPPLPPPACPALEIKYDS